MMARLWMWREKPTVIATIGILLVVLPTESAPAPSHKIDPRCSLEPITGMCRAALPAYYFDPDSGTCKRFTYGGCGGNGWIFFCLEECEIVCVQRTTVDEFVEAIELILRANITDDPNSTDVKKASGSKTRFSRVRLSDGRQGSERRLRLRDKAGTKAVDQEDRELDDEPVRSRHICPLQELFDDVVRDAGDSQAEQADTRHPPRSSS